MLLLELGVRVRVILRFRKAYDKRLGTKRLWYEMSGHLIFAARLTRRVAYQSIVDSAIKLTSSG